MSKQPKSFYWVWKVKSKEGPEINESALSSEHLMCMTEVETGD
jgi:hypothetical protein